MSTDLNASFDERFMNINTKMKKRFMRKPNVSEATNEFIALAIQCEHSDQPAFAGHCYVGAAKCEASIGNFLGEAEHYMAAGRQFMKAEKKLWSLRFCSPDRENLEAAIGSFMQAFSKYPDKSPMRMSILMELANDLASLNHKLEAMSYYQQALELIEDGTMKIMSLRHLLNLQIDCGKLDMALETANTICDLKIKIPRHILTEVQVSRILLALLEKPSNEDKPESLKKLFIDLLNDNDSDVLPMNVDLKLKLQSLIISYASGDSQSLVSVAADTKQYLTTHHNELLNKILTDDRSEKLALS